jgi:hypothetical protein
MLYAFVHKDLIVLLINTRCIFPFFSAIVNEVMPGIFHKFHFWIGPEELPTETTPEMSPNTTMTSPTGSSDRLKEANLNSPVQSTSFHA